MTGRFHELEVLERIEHSADAASFRIGVPHELAEAYRYRAGQHLRFAIPWEGFTIERCYSLSSAPEVDPALEVGVKRVPDGRASNWINDHLVPGARVRVSEPEGRFVLDPDTRASRPLVLLAGGSGITPILSLAKSALASTRRSVTLLYANRDAASVMYAGAVRELARAHRERFELREHLDADGGHVRAEQIRDLVAGRELGEFYVCGPEPFMALVERSLGELGVDEAMIHLERFVSPLDPDRAAAADADASALAAAAAPTGFSLWLHGRSRTVPYTPGRSLLACARAAGFDAPSSCESGYCGSCMARLRTGAVRMRTHEALSERDVERGVVLLCQALPASADPLELDCDSTSFRAASAVRSSLGPRAGRLAAAALLALVTLGVTILRLTPY